jgi:SAM-dependent methyltransferase
MAAIAASVLPLGARDVLDLGCGTGRLARLIADAHPTLSVVGIDISRANIAAATAGETPGRVRFEQADYLAYSGGPFDLIVTDGVLHLIPGDTRVLVRKLGVDLRPSGVLVCCMPYACAYNVASAGVRRALRLVRSAWLDRAILTVGEWLHGREMPAEDLRERVHYMYMAPTRMMNGELRAAMARDAGLQVVGEQPMASVSLAQLRHNVTIFRKDSEKP